MLTKIFTLLYIVRIILVKNDCALTREMLGFVPLWRRIKLLSLRCSVAGSTGRMYFIRLIPGDEIVALYSVT